MNIDLAKLILISGFPLCVLSAVAAFIITYEGHLRHEMPNKKLAFREALRMAVNAFVVFTVLLLIVAYFFVLFL